MKRSDFLDEEKILIEAIRKSDSEKCKEIFKNRSPKKRFSSGYTIFHEAAKYSKTFFFQFLLEYSDDVNQVTIDNITPLTVAKAYKNYDAVRFLQSNNGIEVDFGVNVDINVVGSETMFNTTLIGREENIKENFKDLLNSTKETTTNKEDTSEEEQIKEKIQEEKIEDIQEIKTEETNKITTESNLLFDNLELDLNDLYDDEN